MSWVADKLVLKGVLAGLALGSVFTVGHLAFSPVADHTGNDKQRTNPVQLSRHTVSLDELLVPFILSFGVDEATIVNQLKTPDDASVGKLKTSESKYYVRLVAQALINDVMHTLIEISKNDEKERVIIHEGAVYNGFLVKKVNERKILLERNSKEYAIELFKPQDILLLDTADETN